MALPGDKPLEQRKRGDILEHLGTATNRSRPPATKESERWSDGQPQRLTGSSTARKGKGK
jgi:hypothetical protein